MISTVNIPAAKRPGECHPRRSSLEDHKRNHQTGKDAVADGISDERHPAQQQKVADKSARRGHEKAHQNDPDNNRKVRRPRLDHYTLPVEGRNEIIHERLMISRASKAGGTRMNGMPTSRKLDIFKTRDEFAVRVVPSVVEPLFQLPHRLFSKDVLDLLGVLMHVIGGHMRCVGQIKLPQTMISDDLARTLPAFGSEKCRVAIAGQSEILVTAQSVELAVSFFQGLAASLRQLAGAHLVGFEFLIFQDMVNRFERVFAGDASRARTLPPPASNDSMAWTEKEPDGKNRRCRQHHERARWQISTDKGKERPRRAGNHSEKRREDKHCPEAIG